MTMFLFYFWSIIALQCCVSVCWKTKWINHQFSGLAVSDSLLTPWTAAHQASLSITSSWSLLKLMPIELVMPSNHLILCHFPFSSSLQSFPASGSFQMSQFFTSGGQSIGASATVLSMDTQDWFPLGLTGLITLQSKELSSLLQHHNSKTSIHRHLAFFIVQLTRPYMTTGKIIALTRQTFVGNIISLLFNMLSRFIISFLPRSKHLLISWLQSLSAVIFGAQENKVCHCFHCFPMY